MVWYDYYLHTLTVGEELAEGNGECVHCKGSSLILFGALCDVVNALCRLSTSLFFRAIKLLVCRELLSAHVSRRWLIIKIVGDKFFPKK